MAGKTSNDDRIAGLEQERSDAQCEVIRLQSLLAESYANFDTLAACAGGDGSQGSDFAEA